MIFYGWKTKTVFLAPMPLHSCTRCGAPGSQQLFMNYKSVHLYWVFGVVTNRKYIAQCASCRNQALLPKEEAAPVLTTNPTNPVPFMERWGLAVFGLAIAVLFIVMKAQH